MHSRALLRTTGGVLAAGMLVLALTASSGKGRGNPHTTTTTTTVAPTTLSATTTSPSSSPSSSSSGDSVDAFAAALGFPTRNLAVSDEFNTLDPARWSAKTYTSTGSAVYWNGYNNCSAHDGLLDIAAVHDPNTAGRWDSCFLSGVNAYSGPRFVDVRAKVPAGAGTWAAPGWEWTAPYGAAPGPELDICEQLGREPQTYHASLHYWASGGTDGPGSPIVTSPNAGVNLADGFHDYGMAVHSDRVDFYLDGHQVSTILRSQWQSPWVFDIAAVVLNIDLDMGGSWAGTVDPNLASPVHELVDYIREYT